MSEINIEGSRINVSEAIVLIDRAADRLDFLLKALLEGERGRDTPWWHLGATEENSEMDDGILDTLFFVADNALDDLVRVDGFCYPQSAKDLDWLQKELRNRPVVEWEGPDISCELMVSISCLNLIIESVFVGTEEKSIKHISLDAFRGCRIAIKDILDLLRRLSLEIKEHINSEAA